MFFKNNISNFPNAALILENDIYPCVGIGKKGQIVMSYALILV